MNGFRVFDEVGVDEEEAEGGLGEGLLDADAVEAGSDLSGSRVAGVLGVLWLEDGVVPEAGGAVAALRDPDSGGVLAEVAEVGLDGSADLGTDAFVGAEQRHVTVGGAAGDDVDEAGLLEVLEALDDVAVEGLEVVQRLLKEVLPEAGGLGVVGLAGLGEEGLVFAGVDDLAGNVFRELGEEDGVGELLEQNGREIEVAVEADAIGLEASEDAQERKVGLCGGFMEPLHAVRPGAVIDDVWQMGVEREGQEACGLLRLSDLRPLSFTSRSMHGGTGKTRSVPSVTESDPK